jgi:hypothetical protein
MTDTRQCHACKRRTGPNYLSHGGRHYHTPGECPTFAAAIKAQIDQPRPPADASPYKQFCWELANPEDALEIQGPDKGSRFYLLSCAQTRTPANMDVVNALNTLAKDIGATFLIGALKYKNPNAWHTEQSQYEDELNRECDEKLSQWLIRRSVDLNDSTIFRVSTGATSLNPINAAKRVCDRNVVVAHPVRQQRPIATPAYETPLMLLSTGSVTYPYNYSLSPTGEAAEFHHSYGAALVQVTQDEVMMWPITYDEEQKSVHWLDKRYDSKGQVHEAEIEALILGDFHGVNVNMEVFDSTHKFIKQVEDRLERVIFHDLLDFSSASHWNNVWTLAAKTLTESDSVSRELKGTFEYVHDLFEGVSRIPELVIVPSNHNDHLDRWLIGGKKHTPPLDCSPEDLWLWHQLNSLAMRERLDGEGERCGLQIYYNQVYKADSGYAYGLRWLDRQKPYYVENIDCSQHGDIGIAGAKGSPVAFSRAGRKTFIGHGHADVIEKGCWTVATSSSTKPKYARGYNTMQNSHGIIYKGGCRGKLPLSNGRITL